MPSQIDPSKPTSTNPTVESVRGNFQYAKDEIQALQTALAQLSGVPAAITALQQTDTDYAARLAALESGAPPPPPPPPPTINNLTLTAQWTGTIPVLAYESQDVAITATTNANYVGDEIQIGTDANSKWYASGSNGDYVTLGANDTHTATVNVTLQDPSSAEELHGKAIQNQPPYNTTIATIDAPPPPPPPPPPQIYIQTNNYGTFAPNDDYDFAVHVYNIGGSPLHGVAVTMTATNTNGPLLIDGATSPAAQSNPATVSQGDGQTFHFSVKIGTPQEFDWTINATGMLTATGDDSGISGSEATGTLTGA